AVGARPRHVGCEGSEEDVAGRSPDGRRPAGGRRPKSRFSVERWDMHSFLPRRDVLRLVVVGAAAGALPACTSDDEAPVTAETVFPQGLASGDPKPDSVVLWVRAFPPGGGSHLVSYEVAEDEAFTALVASGQVEVDAATDHTLRLKVTGLSPYTHYHYRF